MSSFFGKKPLVLFKGYVVPPQRPFSWVECHWASLICPLKVGGGCVYLLWQGILVSVDIRFEINLILGGSYEFFRSYGALFFFQSPGFGSPGKELSPRWASIFCSFQELISLERGFYSLLIPGVAIQARGFCLDTFY